MSDPVDVPFYLMPVAAILGMYSLFGGFRLLYLVYVNVKYDPKDRKQTPPLIKVASAPFVFVTVTVLLAIVGYAKIVGTMEQALLESEHALFDPYDLLGVAEASNKTVVTQAYRELVKIHHPDKGGSDVMFRKVQKAYEALTDTIGMENYQKYGHPDGPVTSPGFKLALPQWLLFPEGNIALVMIGLYLFMFVMIALIAIRVVRGGNAAASKGRGLGDSMATTDSVGARDLEHLVANLSPESTHWDVLLAVATTPENVDWSTKGLEKIETMRQEKLAEIKGSQKLAKQSSTASGSSSMAFDNLDDGGWDDDNEEEDEAVKEAKEKAAKMEEEKKKDMERLQKATGKIKELMEGIDEGVLGQKWVEGALEKDGHWPPAELSFLKDKTFACGSKQVSALDHPGIRRNLCCTLGRLHSRMLNTSPELVEAGTKKLLDNTYFKVALEYRHRTGILLEACLRLSIALKSYELTKTVLETAALFKVGCTLTPENIKWFESVVMKEYCILPRLTIKDKKIMTEDEDEIATNDLCTISVEMERVHCEIFLKKKIEMYQKQGIPPQVALQTFREGWWFLVRAEKMDDDDGANVTELFHDVEEIPPFLQEIKRDHVDKFRKSTLDANSKSCLVVAWPVIISNATQKGGTVQMKFKAPKVPGNYKFTINIQSQEFLGADQEFSLDAKILDLEEVQRKQKEKEEKEDAAEEEEEEKKGENEEGEDKEKEVGEEEEEESKKDK